MIAFHVRYSGLFLKWARGEFQQINQKEPEDKNANDDV